jgi:SAM-dependent methyltransferase
MASGAIAAGGQPYTALAPLYDQLVGDAWFPWIRRSFEWVVRRYRIPVGSVADVGCGTGTFLRYLVRLGVPLFGVDRSPAMLAVAAAKNRPGSVRLLRQDLRALRLPRPVDVITCNLDTVNYLLCRRDVATAFSRWRSNLAPRGHLLFDLLVPPRGAAEGRAVWRPRTPPGVATTWTATWSAPRRLSVVEMRYRFGRRPGGRHRAREVHVQRWYPLALIRRLLGEAGFRVRGTHDMETMRAPARWTSWVKVVARRA